jgi:uncharacterized phage infection (PIP) family protein YhgE
MNFGKGLEKIANSVTEGLQKDLTKYKKEAEDALDMFKKTMDKLDTVNEKIDNRVALADTQLNQINELKAQLQANKAGNERVRGKIAEFLA